MKAGRLIELLEGVSPDAEVMCCISTDDLSVSCCGGECGKQ